MRVPVSTTLAALWACLQIVGLRAAVIGIDLGSEFMKVSLVQPGSMMDIVTNIHSKRKTENIVSFYEGERSYGADAYALLSRKPDVTFARLNTLLGRHVSHPAVSSMKKGYYATQIEFNQTKGGVQVKHEDGHYSPEELVAMLLTHGKDITKTFGGSYVHDCVIVTPSFYTQHEKQALLDAAEIADLNVLTLIDENTAAALIFGIDNLHDEPYNVLYYNMGANSLQVSVVTYTAYTQGKDNKKIGQFEVKGKAWDEHLGGFQFDLRIAELLADRFNTKWATRGGKGLDVRAFNRAMAKIRNHAKKVKEVLSANQGIPVHIEGVHDDIDLSTDVTRATFEEISADLFKRATGPIDRALKEANMTLKDINAVEVLGGGIRVPKLQQVLKDHLGGLELGMHLNGDEAMAQGAAFHAANISTSFRVRNVGMVDVNPFPVGVRFENLPNAAGGGWSLFGDKKKKKDDEEAGEGPWTKRATVFKRNNKLNANRTVAFVHDKDVVCNVTYDACDNLPEGSYNTLAIYNITGIEEFAKECAKKGLEKPKVQLTFLLDSSGLVKIAKAEALVKEIVEEKVERKVEKKEEKKKEEKKEVKAEEKKEETKEDKEESSVEDGEGESGEDPSETATKSDEASGKEGAGNSTEASEAKATEVITEIVKKEKTIKRKLDVKLSNQGMLIRPSTPEEKEASKKKLAELRRRDMERAEKAEARNTLEGYLYEVKNKMMEHEEEIAAVSTEEQRTKVLDLVEELDNWLYDEGRDVEAVTYRSKLSEVRALAGAIFLRRTETTARATEVAAAKKLLADFRVLLEKWKVTMPQITDEEREEVEKSIKKVEDWIKEQEEAQAKKAPHEEPAFLSTQVSPKLKSLKETIRRLSRKPKPPPPKVKKNKTETANATAPGNTTVIPESEEQSEKNATEPATPTETETSTQESQEVDDLLREEEKENKDEL